MMGESAYLSRSFASLCRLSSSQCFPACQSRHRPQQWPDHGLDHVHYHRGFSHPHRGNPHCHRSGILRRRPYLRSVGDREYVLDMAAQVIERDAAMRDGGRKSTVYVSSRDGHATKSNEVQLFAVRAC